MSYSFLYPVRERGLWGYIDENFDQRIDSKYIYVSEFTNNSAVVKLKPDVHILINQRGQTIRECQEHITTPRDKVGYYIFKTAGKVGCFDNLGVTVIEPTFAWMMDFRGELACATTTLGKNFGLINRSGDWIVEPKYSEPIYHLESSTVFSASVGVDARKPKMLYDLSGNLLSTISFQWTGCESEGKLPVKFDNGEFGCVNRVGSLLWRNAQLDNLGAQYENGLIPASIDQNWGLVNADGDWHLQPAYTNIGYLHEGIRRVYINGERDSNYYLFNGKFTFMDQDLRIICKPRFEEARDFRNGLARVYEKFDGTDGLFSYLNLSGKIVWNEI